MENKINQINDFLKKHEWCDFNVIDLKGNLKIGGRTGFAEEYDIIITFEDVFYIQCLHEWKTDTKQEAFFMPDITEARTVNFNYSIEQGYHLFKIKAEDIEHPLYISCKNIDVEIQ